MVIVKSKSIDSLPTSLVLYTFVCLRGSEIIRTTKWQPYWIVSKYVIILTTINIEWMVSDLCHYTILVRNFVIYSDWNSQFLFISGSTFRLINIESFMATFINIDGFRRVDISGLRYFLLAQYEAFKLCRIFWSLVMEKSSEIYALSSRNWLWNIQ